MRERPIPFSAPMVRALLDGTKTQTRRVVKPQPELTENRGFVWKGNAYGNGSDQAGTLRNFAKWNCPYGQPGDRLWVRETWNRTNPWGEGGTVMYRATDEAKYSDAVWKPSIHMFRRDSRITLEVTGGRVERLQDITEEDAKAEGIESDRRLAGYFKNYVADKPVSTPRESYLSIWESINGPGSWDANPWVWVVEFKRVTA